MLVVVLPKKLSFEIPPPSSAVLLVIVLDSICVSAAVPTAVTNV